jgi:NADH-quinone oxidoreductase subunit H
MISMDQIIFLPLKFIAYGMGVFLITLYLMYFETRLESFIHTKSSKGTLNLRGIFFPIALFINLFRVRLIFPEASYKFLYVLLPLFFGVAAFSLGMFIPFHSTGFFSDSDYGILWIVAISHFLTYLMVIIGWASQTQYSLQGVVRLFGHFISSSLLFFLVILTVVLWGGSMNLEHIIEEQKSVWFVLPLFPVFLIHIIVLLMRGRGAPFGMSESGIDLIGGYKSQYSGGLSVFLIISEHLHFLLFSALTIVLFFGGWLPLWAGSSLSGASWFALKLVLFLVCITGVKSTLPNLRYDQIVRLNFKVFFPFIALLFIVYCFLKAILNL